MHPTEIDAVVMHAPGTVKGDQAEINAISTLIWREFTGYDF